MKLSLIIFLLSLVGVTPVWSETIVFQSGKSLDGKILDQTSDSVTFVDKKGSKSSISKRKIYKILFNASEKEQIKAVESSEPVSFHFQTYREGYGMHQQQSPSSGFEMGINYQF